MSSTATWPSDAPPPDAIPNLLLLRRIGKGGFGQVWLAENRTSGRLLAVKLVPLKSAPSAAAAGFKEIHAIRRMEQRSSIRHPHLLPIHHVGTTDDFLYYTMDPADDMAGRPASRRDDYTPATLGTRLRAGRVDAEVCVAWAQQLVAALAHLHEQGLVHRDVKPDNCIFLDGELKLGDFGLVTEADGSISLAGTLKYMPRDRTMDARADVYAAGLVLYEMYSGNPVDRFPSLVSGSQQLFDDPRLAALNRIALRAADHARENRYADAGEMLADLQLAWSSAMDVPRQAGQGTSLRRLVASVRGRRAAMIVAGCLLLLLGLVTASWWPTGRRQPPEPVHVNFITEPSGAQIVLNGSPVQSDSGPFVTPCSIPGLVPGVHHVAFRHPQLGEVEAGAVNFALVREVHASWPVRGADSEASPPGQPVADQTHQ